MKQASGRAWRPSVGTQGVAGSVRACKCLQGQAGIALVTALLVVSLATTAAAALLSEQQIDFARTENVLNSEQAYQYGLGVEAWATGLLEADRKTSDTDHLQEPWATELEPLMVDGGEVSGYTEDMQGRFNVNSLAESGESGAVAKERFERLLSLVGGTPSIADALADWLDADSEVRSPSGAEDEAYLNEQPPYRVANSTLVSVSELRLIRGVTKELYRALSPYVAALPGATSINVNTASIAVLRSIVPGLTEGEAKLLIGARGKTGFATVDEFLAEISFLGRQANALGLGVTSDYFQTRAKVNVARTRTQLSSLLQRSASGFTQVIGRSEARE